MGHLISDTANVQVKGKDWHMFITKKNRWQNFWFMVVLFVISFNARAQNTVTFESFTKIDVHTHVFEVVPGLTQWMKDNDVQHLNINVHPQDRQELINRDNVLRDLHRTEPAVWHFSTTFELDGFEAEGYVEKVKAWLDESFEAGAVSVKIWKDIGMVRQYNDGRYLMADDSLFDAIYTHIAQRGKVLITHLGDPIDAWLPLDEGSVHYGYFSTHPDSYMYGKEGVPSYEEIMTARDNILEKYPELIMIGTHMGSMAHDLDMVAERFDKYPNFYSDVAARLGNLKRHSDDDVRNFIIKYQDRLMYGSDNSGAGGTNSHLVKQYSYFVDRLNLPDIVLEKFFYKNAQRILFDRDSNTVFLDASGNHPPQFYYANLHDRLLRLNIRAQGPVSIQIMSLRGEKVWQREMSEGAQAVYWHIPRQVGKGCFLVQVLTGKRVYFQKIYIDS